MRWWGGRLLGSRIARLIFASNLAGLIILGDTIPAIGAVFIALGFVGVLLLSNPPEGGTGPPPLLLNAIVSITALVGLLVGGSFLDSSVESTTALAESTDEKWSLKSFRGGIELGFWKGLGE